MKMLEWINLYYHWISVKMTMNSLSVYLAYFCLLTSGVDLQNLSTTAAPESIEATRLDVLNKTTTIATTLPTTIAATKTTTQPTVNFNREVRFVYWNQFLFVYFFLKIWWCDFTINWVPRNWDPHKNVMFCLTWFKKKKIVSLRARCQ